MNHDTGRTVMAMGSPKPGKLARERGCALCGTKEVAGSKLKLCAGCKAVAYCSAQCQAGDWTQHKLVCGKHLPGSSGGVSAASGDQRQDGAADLAQQHRSVLPDSTAHSGHSSTGHEAASASGGGAPSSTASPPRPAPLFEYFCIMCKRSCAEQDLEVCPKCQLSAYCPSCREAAQADVLHRDICPHAAALAGGRSFIDQAVLCMRVFVCFEHLGFTANDFHPLQTVRWGTMESFVEFAAYGEVAPVPSICFNSNCNRNTEIIDFESELELRQFVLDGLCAVCQREAYAGLKAYEGGSGEDGPPSHPPRLELGPAVPMGNQKWLYLQHFVNPTATQRLKLIARSTVWQGEGSGAGLKPLWVAGELLEVVAFWERTPDKKWVQSPNASPPHKAKRGDGEVTLMNGAGKLVWVDARTFREHAEACGLEIGFAVSINDVRGCPQKGLKRLPDDLHLLPPLGAYELLCTVPQYDVTQMAIMDQEKTLERDADWCAVFVSLFHLMAEDKQRRADGSYTQYWSSLMPKKRKPVRAGGERPPPEIHIRTAQDMFETLHVSRA